MKLTIDIDLEIIESFEDKNIVSRVYYPDEGNKIQIIKDRNKLEFSKDILHEIGHLFDWYLSSGNLSEEKSIREKIANKIENIYYYL